MSLSEIAIIVTTIGPLLAGCIWLYPRIYKLIMKPTIIWGLCDCPTGSIAYYFVRAKWRSRNNDKLKVIIKLIPNYFSPEDYSVNITKFCVPCGCENSMQIKTEHRIERGLNLVEFEMEKNVLYKITVESNCGRVRCFIVDNFDLKVECLIANVKNKIVEYSIVSLKLFRSRLH